jgi:hypothetical protein
MSFSTFPGQNSIPPVTFYTMQGLAPWLNNNPTYKRYFINYPVQFPGLYPTTAMTNPILSTTNYNIENVPLASQVITLSQYELQKYREQLNMFIRVYGFNSNAYINSTPTSPPLYYSFSSYQELMCYKASVSFVNKLYPFNAMSNGTDENGNVLGWTIPFPL